MLLEILEKVFLHFSVSPGRALLSMSSAVLQGISPPDKTHMNNEHGHLSNYIIQINEVGHLFVSSK